MARAGGWIALMVGLGALALSVWWLVRPAAESAPAPRPPFVLPVTLCTLERGELRPRAALTGTVRAARRAELAFEVDGTLRELAAEEAQAVEQGARLARLDDRDEELALAAAEAALALAQREQELLVAGEREEEKRRLEAVLAAARAEEELARSEVGRGEKLLESRVISESEQDRRTSELSVAEKRRVAAEEQHARALAGTRQEDLAIAAARVDEARASVETARHALEKTRLLAPWSGRVVRRHVSSGAFVSSGDPVYELVDLDHLEVHVDVPGHLAERLGSATRASVRVPGADARLETELDALVPAADEAARSFRAILRLAPEDNRLGLLKPGMFLDVELLLEPVPDALLAPSDAVLAGERGPYVVRAAAGSGGSAERPALVAELVPVRVLARDGGRAAIEGLASALAPGDRLVLTGADNAFPGAALAARDPAGDAPAAAGPR
jgi:RND family efflux transporter MFP subunit